MMRTGKKVYFGAALAAAIALALGAGDAGAWLNYSDSKVDNVPTGNCVTCHGDFRASPYADWGTDLMGGHESVITDCFSCHNAGFYPVPTAQSSGTFTMGCLGCHGRFEDDLGSVAASGLRQHHWDAGITICGSELCHPSDSNPDLYMPVGEDVLPPNYDVNTVISLTDPCNPGGAGENFAGDSGGLDNDGDELIDGRDELDSDCFLPTTTTTTTAAPTTTTAAPTTTTAAPTTTTAAPTTTTAAPTTTTAAPTTTTAALTTRPPRRPPPRWLRRPRPPRRPPPRRLPRRRPRPRPPPRWLRRPRPPRRPLPRWRLRRPRRRPPRPLCHPMGRLRFVTRARRRSGLALLRRQRTWHTATPSEHAPVRSRRKGR